MTEIDSTSLFTIIISSIVSVLGAVGGLEFIKFTVRTIQGKSKRKLKEKGDTTDFYKKELDELQDRYRKQEDRLNDLQKQVIELNQQITKQAATIAELSS
jgi:septal ring factor EnvC (AmiA/AmiB activator)